MCVSWGKDDWRGPQILGESVIGREIGNWDWEYEVEVEEGEKDEPQDGGVEKVEEE